MKMWATAVIVFCLVVVALGCGKPATAPSSPAPAAPPAANPGASEAADGSPGASADVFVATVKVVDPDGNPLAGMMPIATRQPNAFDPPLARGPLTGPSGAGEFTLPNNESLYIRAWDPQQRLFANNYFEALPADGNRTPEMTIVMYPAARLVLALAAPDGKPLVNSTVGLMLSHPTLGPWWPSEARTDDAGHVSFAPLPPGKYTARFKADTGATLEVSEVGLMPGETTALPPQTLR